MDWTLRKGRTKNEGVRKRTKDGWKKGGEERKTNEEMRDI